MSENNLYTKIISDNLESFSQLINLKTLTPNLSLTYELKDKFESIQFAIQDKYKELILKNLIQNEEQLNEFINILLHSNHDKLARALLDQFKDLPTKQNILNLIDLNRCHPMSSEIPIEDKLKTPRKADDVSNTYAMFTNPRGFCLLINNYFTVGTYNEMQRFRNIFYQLHFDVIMEKNLSAEQIENQLIELSRREVLKKHNAFVFMIITHGNYKQINGFNGKPIEIERIINIFNNTNCPHLQDKPRMFFFNCCRGKYGMLSLNEQYPTIPSPLGQTPFSTIQIDLLVCFSTLEGHITEVSWETGTQFGKVLADTFVEKVWYRDINTILTYANEQLIKESKGKIAKGIEWNSSRLKKHLLFYPYLVQVTDNKLDDAMEELQKGIQSLTRPQQHSTQ